MFIIIYLLNVFSFLADLYWVVNSFHLSVFKHPGSLEFFEDEWFPAEISREPCPHPICCSYHWYDYHHCGWIVISSFQEIPPLQTEPLLILVVPTIFLLQWKQEQNPFPNAAHILASIARSAHPWNKLVDLILQTFPLFNVFLRPLSHSQKHWKIIG